MNDNGWFVDFLISEILGLIKYVYICFVIGNVMDFNLCILF